MKVRRDNIRTARILSLIQGILMVIVGIIFLRNPISSLITFTFVLAILAIISGVLGIIRYFAHSAFNSGGFLIISILEIIFGILLYQGMPFSTITFAYFIGFIVLFSAVSQIATSLDLRNTGIDRWWIGLISSILGIIVSIMLLRNPGLAPIYIGIYFIITGIGLVSIFFALGRLKDKVEEKIDGNN